MIVNCATCEHDDDGRCPNDSTEYSVTLCDQYSKWVESIIAKAIREEERERIIKLIEAKQADVENKLSEIKYRQHHSKIYDEGQLEGKRDMCELPIDQLRGES